jgi:thiol-disulfide isomerase/thioredoxin
MLKLTNMCIIKEAFYKLLIATLISFSNHVIAQVSIDTAVDFSVKDVNSVSHHLFDYLDNDKIIVIDFFTTNCGPCQTYASHVSQAYEYFGCNEGNVIFLGMNWGSNNDEVRIFDSLWGAHYPSVSGLQGGGNGVVDNYQVLSYPTVAIITPDRLIANHLIWPPAYDSIVQEVLASGGIPGQCTVSNSYVTEENPMLRILSSGELFFDKNMLEGKNTTLTIYSVTGVRIMDVELQHTVSGIIKLPLETGVYIGVFRINNRFKTIKMIIP